MSGLYRLGGRAIFLAMRAILMFALCLIVPSGALHAQNPDRIVALGDSLTAGYGLPAGEDFASKLQQELVARGLNVRIENAGISGNTTEDGKRRVAQAIAGDEKPRLVIVALGANDMLRRIEPATTRDNLSSILSTLRDKDIPVFLIGMRNPMGIGPFMGGPYAGLYKDLAKEYDVPFFPFFLKDVAMDKSLNLPDGMHPNEKGIAVMVENIAPDIVKALKD